MVSRPVGIQGHLQAENIQSYNLLSPVKMMMDKRQKKETVIRKPVFASYDMSRRYKYVNFIVHL